MSHETVTADAPPKDNGHETARRLALARDIGRVYSRHPDARAVLICGSVSRGWADRWSDLELVVIWSDFPGRDVRAALAETVGAGRRQIYPPDAGLGTEEEEFALAGIKVDLAHMTTSGLERILDDVTRLADESVRKHALVAGIRDAVALSGHDLLLAWQVRTSVYPPALRSSMIEKNLIFGPHRWLQMLAGRNDLLALHDVLCRIERTLLNILLALNSTYATSDSFKWVNPVASQLVIAPHDLASRLERVLREPPEEGVREAGLLIEETLRLVEHHVPEVSVDRVRARITASGAT